MYTTNRIIENTNQRNVYHLDKAIDVIIIEYVHRINKIKLNHVKEYILHVK